VRGPNPAEEAVLKAMPFEEDTMRQEWQIDSFVTGVKGYDAVKRLYFQPTATIAGLTSGWQGTGAKTVLPAAASAKIDFRLVPNLSPDIVLDLLRKHLDKHGFADIEIKLLGGYQSEISDPNSHIMRAAKEACRKVHKQEAVHELLCAGSGPMWSFHRQSARDLRGHQPPRFARALAKREFHRAKLLRWHALHWRFAG
jgi:acetylornithine deacetylase/succinyl-diaminopimelate desuccinylase-like protein